MSDPVRYADSTIANDRHYAQRLGDWFAYPPRSAWILRILFAALVVNLFVLALYVVHGYWNSFHTDASTKNLLAQEMLETGRFFPRDWNYQNRDLMVVFGQVLIWPLLPFFKNGFALHAFSGLVFSAAILGSLWKLTALTCAAKWQRVAIVAIFAGGLSFRTAENIFGQVSYGVVLLLSCIVVVVAWQTLVDRDRRLHLGLLALWLVLLLATWSNPQRALISYLLPLFAAVGAHVLWGGAAVEIGRRLRRGFLTSSVAILGFVSGAACSAFVLERVQNINGVASPRWLAFEGIVNNLVHSAQAVIAMLGGTPPAGHEVVSLAGAYVSVRLVVAFVLMLLLPWGVWRAVRIGRPALKFLAMFVAIQCSAILFLFATTTIPDMIDPATSGRYLAPSVLLGLVVLFSIPLSRSRLGLNVVVSALMGVLLTSSMVRLGDEALPVRSYNPTQTAILEALRTNNLKYGYATYWNSGVYTVLSGGESRIRQISIEHGRPVPMRHLSSNRWYEAEAWGGSTFLLLNQAEEELIDWDAMEVVMGVQPKRVQVAHLTAFVYPENIAKKMPSWSRSFDRAVGFPALPTSMRTHGHWDGEMKAVVIAKGESGLLAYGPYIRLPAGRYRAEFEIASPGSGEGGIVAVVDVVHELGNKVIDSLQVVGPVEGKQVLEFELAKPVEQVEMRVLATGAADVTYRGVTLHPVANELDGG